MGFPYDVANWGLVDGSQFDGAYFMGAGGLMPGLYSLIAIFLCLVVLWMGNSSEHKQYDKVGN